MWYSREYSNARINQQDVFLICSITTFGNNRNQALSSPLRLLLRDLKLLSQFSHLFCIRFVQSRKLLQNRTKTMPNAGNQLRKLNQAFRIQNQCIDFLLSEFHPAQRKYFSRRRCNSKNQTGTKQR